MSDALTHLVNRGVEEVFPSKENLLKKLAGKERLRIYTGIDPTGPTLHIGHAIVLKKIKEFQDLGHEIILLIGDFTAMIGDPTDKLAVRKSLTEAEIKRNLKLYKKQASTFIRFTGKNKARIEYNSKWLKNMKMKQVLELTSLMTVEQMLKRDMFARRMEEGKPIFIHEFMYPLLQGYDSVQLNVDVEIGGNDQMFNMLVGRDFQKKLNGGDKVAITMKLLTDNTGKKMGKSEGNMVSLADTHFDMFGKIMSWTDGMVMPGFELCTNISIEELESIKISIENGSLHPKAAKVRLASEVVALYHGEAKAKEAMENFENTFAKGGVSEDVTELKAGKGTLLGTVLVENGIVASMGEFRRLITSDAISDSEGHKIKDAKALAEHGVTYKIGKRKFCKIIAE